MKEMENKWDNQMGTIVKENYREDEITRQEKTRKIKGPK